VNRLLIVEDNSKHARMAGDVATSLGFLHVEICRNLRSALGHLEHGLQGHKPLPNAIILDLDLELDSGYDLLLLRHNSPRLLEIPLIVWTQLCEENGYICELFDVTAVIYKWEGIERLREALADLERQPAS
jgi:CheY-like chemotaxis protein